jgi:hypothetical protein
MEMVDNNCGRFAISCSVIQTSKFIQSRSPALKTFKKQLKVTFSDFSILTASKRGIIERLTRGPKTCISITNLKLNKFIFHYLTLFELFRVGDLIFFKRHLRLQTKLHYPSQKRKKQEAAGPLIAFFQVTEQDERRKYQIQFYLL